MTDQPKSDVEQLREATSEPIEVQPQGRSWEEQLRMWSRARTAKAVLDASGVHFEFPDPQDHS